MLQKIYPFTKGRNSKMLKFYIKMQILVGFYGNDKYLR